MESVRLTLFRIQAHLPSQESLFSCRLKPSEIIRRAILEKPSGMYWGSRWLVANTLSGTGSYPEALVFAIGKPTKKHTPTIDPDSGDFCAVPLNHAPHTYAVADLSSSVLAIQNGGGVGSSVETVAKALKALLEQTEIVREQQCKVAIDLIRDPTHLIKAIRESDSLTKLSVSFTLPNAFDHGQFQHHVQVATNMMDASESQVVFVGESMNKDEAEELIRQGGAIGKTVTAWVRRWGRRRSTRIKMGENPVTVDVPVRDSSGVESQDVLLADDVIRAINDGYNRVRHK